MESIRPPLDVRRNTSNSQAWRKPGQKLRARLVKKDAGVNGFVLSPNCSIEKYHQVSEKVLDQFLQHPIETKEELLEAYMVGMRLLRFLDEVLPTHPDYQHNKQAQARATKHSKDLVKYIDEIAIMVDREEHEAFISKVLVEGEDEDEDDDDEVHHHHQQLQQQQQHEYHNNHQSQSRKDRQIHHNQHHHLDDSANSHHTPARSEDLTAETAATSLSSSPDHSNEAHSNHLFYEPALADEASEAQSQEVDISLFRSNSWKKLDESDEGKAAADWDAAWAKASSAKASQRREPSYESGDGWSNFTDSDHTFEESANSSRRCALLARPSGEFMRRHKSRNRLPPIRLGGSSTGISRSTSITTNPTQVELRNMRHMESVLQSGPMSHSMSYSISSCDEGDESKECVLNPSQLSSLNNSFPSEADSPFLNEKSSTEASSKIGERFNEKSMLVKTQVVDWDNASFASKQMILDMNHQLALRGKPGDKLRLIDTEEEDSAEDLVAVSTGGRLMCKRRNKKPIGHHFRQCVKFLLEED